MLNRNFKESNKEYFKKNKVILITITVFLLIGMLLLGVLGLNGNFEIKGYNEFSVTINETIAKNYSKHKDKVCNIVNAYDGKFDTMLISAEGDNTLYIVRYINSVTAQDKSDINRLVAQELGISETSISIHTKVGPVVRDSDIIYTIATILLITVIATIFACVRYNGASALAVIIANIFGSLTLISFTSILRLSVGLSYFAMLVILNLLTTYCAINMFESMHKSRWLVAGDYDTAIKEAFSANKVRLCVLSVAVALIGLIMALIVPMTMKYVAVNVIFIGVTMLATGWYVIPFVWSVFITSCRKRDYKIKVDNN